MKKMRVLVFALLCSLSVLTAEAIRATAEAALCCNDLVDCCNSECCGGPGSVNVCTLTCQGGTIIECPRRGKDGGCH